MPSDQASVHSRLTLQQLRVYSALAGGTEVSITRLWKLARPDETPPVTVREQQQLIGAIVALINQKLPPGHRIVPGALKRQTYQLRRDAA